jgi:hypothetical protein
MHSVLCEFGQFCIDQTGRSIETTVKVHQRHIRLAHPGKSAMAEHIINLDNRIQHHHPLREV